MVPTLAPCSAAPVRIRPRIGPAQGAHSRPVATPSSSDGRSDGADPSPARRDCDSRVAQRDERPRQPIGRARKEQRDAEQREQRERDDAAVLVGVDGPAAADRGERRDQRRTSSAMPISIGSPLSTNGRSARANTKGSTGRMQGLRIVSTPPR